MARSRDDCCCIDAAAADDDAAGAWLYGFSAAAVALDDELCREGKLFIIVYLGALCCLFVCSFVQLSNVISSYGVVINDGTLSSLDLRCVG